MEPPTFQLVGKRRAGGAAGCGAWRRVGCGGVAAWRRAGQKGTLLKVEPGNSVQMRHYVKPSRGLPSALSRGTDPR